MIPKKNIGEKFQYFKIQKSTSLRSLHDSPFLAFKQAIYMLEITVKSLYLREIMK